MVLVLIRKWATVNASAILDLKTLTRLSSAINANPTGIMTHLKEPAKVLSLCPLFPLLSLLFLPFPSLHFSFACPFSFFKELLNFEKKKGRKGGFLKKKKKKKKKKGATRPVKNAMDQILLIASAARLPSSMNLKFI